MNRGTSTDAGGVRILQPYARQDGAKWYEGTADALRQNLEVLEDSGAERVFLLSADLVYRMDYSWMLETHLARRAKVSVAVAPPPSGESNRFVMVNLGEDGRIDSAEVRPETSNAPYAFMGVLLFEIGFLLDLLRQGNQTNLLLDLLLPRLTDPEVARAYVFEGYWDDVSAVPRYFRAHQRLLDPEPAPDLTDPGWRIYTRSEEMPPVWFRETALVQDSLLANGAIVEGRVERSVLSPGVHVGPGAVVRNSVLLNNAVIGPNAVVERSIIDKHVTVGRDARVGAENGPPGPTDGIAVIGKWAAVKSGTVVPAGAEVTGGDPVDPGVYHARMEETLR